MLLQAKYETPRVRLPGIVQDQRGSTSHSAAENDMLNGAASAS